MEKLRFFVDLKRFEIQPALGGICEQASPVEWAETLIADSIALGIDKREDLTVTYYFPESCLVPALQTAERLGCGESLLIGSQGLYRRDTVPGGDYGAMTAACPASAMIALGVYDSLIAHSDQRRDKFMVIADYDSAVLSVESAMERANLAIDRSCGEEALHALERGMRILYCIGETEAQKGSDEPEIYIPRVRRVIEQQLETGLGRLKGSPLLDNVTLTYEPVWAIGPGKKTPDAAYVRFAAGYMKEKCLEILGRELPIVYGGGLRTANAGELASVEHICGGFNGLSRFTPPIHFRADEYLEIIESFIRGKKSAGAEK